MIVILKNSLLTLLPIVFILVVRTGYHVVPNGNLKSDSDSLGRDFLVSLLGVSCVVSIIGYTSRGPVLIYKVLLALILLLTTLRIIWCLVHGHRSTFRTLCQRALLDGKQLLPAYAIATYAITPAYLHLSQAGTKYGISTLFNGDIANYSLVADNVMVRGYSDSLHISNANYGTFAKTNSYTTANGLLSFVSTLSGRPIYQILLPSLCIAIMFLYFALGYLYRSVADTRQQVVMYAITLGILNSLTVHTIGQYYISAILCTAGLSFVLGAVLRLVPATNKSDFVQTSLILVVSLSFCIYSYGHIGLVATFACPFFSAFIFLVSRQGRQADSIAKATVTLFLKILICSGLALILSTPALNSAWKLFLTQSNVQAGYGLKDLNPVGIFLFPSWIRPSWTSGNLSLAWDAITWTALIILVLSVWWLAKGRFWIREIMILVVGIGGLAALAAVVWDVGSYQTWKLWSLLLPIFIILVCMACTRMPTKWSDTLKFGYAVLVGISLSVPWSVWGERVWNPSTATVLTKEFETSLKRVNQLDLDSLNVNLNPYLETMMAGTVIKGTMVAFNSDSYIGMPLQLPDTCTLTRKELVPQGASFRALVGPYVLAFYPSLCKR